MLNISSELLYSINIIIEALPSISQGILVTIITVFLALFIGLILGIPMAILRVYGPPYIRYSIQIYCWFFRGIPILLLLFLFYFGLFELFQLDFSAITTSCIVLGIASSSYQTQIVRSAIQMIPSGQLKAAKALGMTNNQAILVIILPQALRLSIPGWSNEYSILLKDSAICFVLGAPEIMAQTHFIASRTYEYLLLYILAGALYFLITLIGVSLLRRLEQYLYLPGYTASPH